ncbi:Retrovirus-related Pol polyprotein from transposon RE1 (Retro element 1) (AtRE1) [Includes: Protease RE1 [Durusdinium trenchii]|uniref:Retrovirus-related Pol polyprotein from transposon RE1 (Retro element 1) (AtRE1) n=1 Tax=Durusdinium trenchii TaxID=1381693 RepID=A0ABP0QHI5_9DINO
MDNAKEWLVERGGTDWQLIPLEEELGKMWASQESANADVLLIFCAANARKLRKRQPFASPAEATLRKSLLLLRNEVEQPDADDPRAREREVSNSEALKRAELRRVKPARGPFPRKDEDMSSGSTSMARMRYESERDAKKARRDSEFFAKKERERKQAREERSRRILLEEQQRAAAAPIPEYDPELDDYHQSSPSKRLPVVAESPEVETQEREAKRLRGDDIDATAEGEGLFCYLVIEQPRLLKRKAKAAYFAKELEYALLGISYDDFTFGFRRNRFDRHYEEMYDFAMNATPGTAAGKKRGRKEILLRELPEELSKLFTDDGESDEKEWRAWQEKDVRNAYFSGKSLDREVYLEQPKGGLRGLKPGQLLLARKAIYGFSEAARMFWVALKEHLQSDGWVESRLEPALFYLREQGQLRGILVTHVHDIEGGVDPNYLDVAFRKSSRALEFATNHFKEFVFRGREIKQHESGHIDIAMRNYSLNTKKISISNVRKAQVESSLTESEMKKCWWIFSVDCQSREVEAGDWCICLLEEALSGELNLKDWPAVIQRRKRVYVTDARSVYDCLQKDATSTSTDKRMALEGALLREIVRQPQAFVRWIDGMQNVANVLTKSGAEKDTLREFLREGMMSLVQSEANKKIKEKKGADRHRRSVELDKPTKKREANVQRRRKLAEELQGVDVSSGSDRKEKE